MKKNEEGVPVFSRWRHWYIVVILFLAVVICLLYFFSAAYE